MPLLFPRRFLYKRGPSDQAGPDGKYIARHIDHLFIILSPLWLILLSFIRPLCFISLF